MRKTALTLRSNGRKRHALCPTRQRPICTNDGESRQVAWSLVGCVLLCKLRVIQITINWPVSASSILKDTTARFAFYKS